ncbi:MAG: SRPBCC domain-containing protein [Balneola sp.]
MKEYKIEIEINASKEAVWNTITDFKNFQKWNSVLAMKNNDSLILGDKFDVTIVKPNKKHSSFKAVAVSKNDVQSFAARQKMIGKWVFQATHYFIIKETDKENIKFIQKWELKGIIASLFRKQIFKELEEFKKMNMDLKRYVEK